MNDSAAPSKEPYFPAGEKKDYVQKELDQIQAIITRMGTNSFQCKGWALGIVTLVLAISQDSFLLSDWQSMILLLPVVVFWYLDGFFLYTEQRYRDLFNSVVRKRFHKLPLAPDSDWSNFFDYNYTRFEHPSVLGKGYWIHFWVHIKNRIVLLWHRLKRSNEKAPDKINTIATAMFSKTLSPFYILPTLFILFAASKGSGVITWPKATEKEEQITVQLDSSTLAPMLRILEKMQQLPEAIVLTPIDSSSTSDEIDSTKQHNLPATIQNGK